MKILKQQIYIFTILNEFIINNKYLIIEVLKYTV